VVVGATSAVIPNVDCGDDSGSELVSANRSSIFIASYGGGFSEVSVPSEGILKASRNPIV
jgi:hypothetical protein